MRCTLLLAIAVIFISPPVRALDARTVMNLNGTWEFDQTTDAFPPQKFTRKIQVPGLITLAEPGIEDYNKFVRRPGQVVAKDQHSLYDIDYTPRYSWYRKVIYVDRELEGSEAVLYLKKSQYVTQIFVNGIDLGTSMACYTPVECRATGALKFGMKTRYSSGLGPHLASQRSCRGTDKKGALLARNLGCELSQWVRCGSTGYSSSFR
jgi:hypothetical protein